VIGYKHIAFVHFDFVFGIHFIIKSTRKQNAFGPNSSHDKKVRIPSFFENRNYQKREHNDNWKAHHHVKPDAPKYPKNNFKYFHIFKSKNSILIFSKSFTFAEI
jgi:hypothetical protein